MSASQKYHEQRIKTIEKLSKEAVETREKAQQEMKNLDALYKTSVTNMITSDKISSEKVKIKLRQEFISKLKDSDELISNMNKYLCFSLENKRFFNVSF